MNSLRRWAVALGLSALVNLPRAAPAQPAAPAPPAAAAQPPAAKPPTAPATAPPPPPQETKDEGREHFEKGLTLLDEEAYDAALAEFMRSREIRPTKAATKNAAICLRKLKRFDEALDMFEELLKFPNLPPADKELGEREVKTLTGLVGRVDIRGAEMGASITIDGRSRGTAPSPPIRASTGTHIVRVFKDGYEAYERRINVVGGQTVGLEAHLIALSQSGHMRVVEQSGKVLDVAVDNTVVGKTPWDGTLAPGDHTVFLRGDGDLGTQPASVPVKLNQLANVVLTAEPLPGRIDVRPTPAGAGVAIDGVTVTRGQWQGRLRLGDHKVEVKMDGFTAQTKPVRLVAGKLELVEFQLEREGGRLFVEIDVGAAISPSLGGAAADGCTAPCSGSLGLGFVATAHAGYRFGSGFLLEVQGGYLWLHQTTTGRKTTALPVGQTPNPGTANDDLTLRGPMLGAGVGYRLPKPFPMLFRLGGGVHLANLADHRTGAFTTVDHPTTGSYNVDVAESPSAYSFYLAPEARFGFRVGKVVELSLGVQALLLFSLGQPTWVPDAQGERFLAAPAGAKTTGDGVASFAADALAGKVVVVMVPSVGARFEF